jgi:hypothetical protein
LGPTEGANPNLWMEDGSKGQLPKRNGLVLEYWTMDQVKKNSNIERNTPSLEPRKMKSELV